VSGGVSVGPNPARVGGEVSIYRNGGKPVSGKLFVFDAIGQKVAVVEVGGTRSLSAVEGGKIGTWKVGDVAEGAYLLRGVLTDKDGVKVKVSALVSVVR